MQSKAEMRFGASSLAVHGLAVPAADTIADEQKRRVQTKSTGFMSKHDAQDAASEAVKWAAKGGSDEPTKPFDHS